MYYIGVDLGGTNMAAGICDDNGKILVKNSVPADPNRPADEIMDDMAALCLGLADRQGISVGEIDSIGIASPGIADPDSGSVIYSCNFPTFRNYPVCAKLSERTGVSRVFVANDANAAAKGESVCGAAKGCRDSVFVTLGTGVGGGIITDGKIYTGFNYAGAEIGHIVIVHGGRQCACGRKGCFESYASATGLINLTREKMESCPESLMWDECGGNPAAVNGRTSFDAMRRGDTAAQEVVDEYIGYLACGIVNIINIFQPEILSIGGGISNEREYLLAPLRKIVEKEQYSRDCEKKTELRIAQLGNDAGIVGAAMLGK
ncbi:MAG: ROK family protein [Eubacteriales bacterium]